MESLKRPHSTGNNSLKKYHSFSTRKNNSNETSKSFDSTEETPKKKTFKRLMVRFADKSSMTGVTYINSATLIVSKVLWSILLVAALAAMTGHLYILIDNYYLWPKTAKIELGFANLPFPEVTICNTNPIHRSRLEKFNGAYELKELLEELDPLNLVPEQFDSNLFKDRYLDDYEEFGDDEGEEDEDVPDNQEGHDRGSSQQDDNQTGGGTSEDGETSDGMNANGGTSGLNGNGTSGNDGTSDGVTANGGKSDQNENGVTTNAPGGLNSDTSSGGTSTDGSTSDKGSSASSGNTSDGNVADNGDTTHNTNDGMTSDSGTSDNNGDTTDNTNDGMTSDNGTSDNNGDTTHNTNDGETSDNGTSDNNGDTTDNTNDDKTSDNGTSDNNGDTTDNTNDGETSDNGTSDNNGDTTDNTNDGETSDNGTSDNNGDTTDNTNDGMTSDNGTSDNNGDTTDNTNDGMTSDNGSSDDNGDTTDNTNDGETSDNGTSDNNGDTTDNTDNKGDGKTSDSGTSDDNGGNPQDPSRTVKKRRKRFTEKYGKFDLSKFDSEYEEEEEEEEDFEEFEYDFPKDNQTKVDEVFKRLFMAINKTDRAALGHDISDMLLSCSFNGRVCDATQFSLHQTSDYGNCWTLSSNKLTVLDSGPRGGLSMVLYLETTEYLYGVTQGYGISVQILQKGAYPDPFQEGINIPASMETDIGLKTIYINRMGKPHGNCESGDAFQSAYGRRYTRRACQQMCRVISVLDTCGCYDEETEAQALDARPDATVCSLKNETACMTHVNRQFELKNMTCTCDNPCTETVYSKSVSSRQWPTEYYAYVLLDGVCQQNVNACQSIRGESESDAIHNNFIKLNIYYEDLNYEQIQEEADISQAQLLSDVGGAIGLWIGLSILSFCEIIQLFFEIVDLLLYKLRRPRRKRREKRRQNESDSYPDERYAGVSSPKKRISNDAIFSRYGMPTRFANDFRNSRNNGNEYENGFGKGLYG